MNIFASYDWLTEYVSLKAKPEDVANKLSLSGPSVERLIPQGADLENIVLGHILKIEPHPNADKLRLVSVDVGDKTLSVVCGGSNLAQGQWVAVAKIGARVHWHGEGEPVELKPAEIRGVKSEGMICGANEIGLFDAFPHAEREILDFGKELKFSVSDDSPVRPRTGTPVAKFLGLENDEVMEIEVTTNRPDLLGMVGLAREASAILKRPFLWKPPKAPVITLSKKKNAPEKGKAPEVSVRVHEKKLCPRYMGIRMDNIAAGPSPWWMKRRLLSAGLRPINNLVDITNYVMLELGQPMHVFDAKKLEGDKILVRKAKAGETIAALDGKTYDLDDSMLVIADASKPVAIAGVMGGEPTAVTLDTTSVIFEAATFDPVSVRRTAHKLNCYSDSQMRFEKGLSVQSPPVALARAVELCRELAGGIVVTPVADAMSKPYEPLKYSIAADDVSTLMGVPLAPSEMKTMLERLGFKVTMKPQPRQMMTAVVPWWRDHDIENSRDLVEEIARLYGYDRIPAVFPPATSILPRDPGLVWEDRLRDFARSTGLTGVFTYSFVSRSLLEKADYDPNRVLRIQNPISDDFEFMRTSLLPSMIQVVADNQERFRRQRLFEIAHIYPRRLTDKGNGPWTDLPDEQTEFVAAFFDQEASWKEAKGFAVALLEELGIDRLTWKLLTEDEFWHPGRTIRAFAGETPLVTIGELHPRLAENFKLEGRLSFVSASVPDLLKFATTSKHYVPMPVYPESKRDLALIVERKTSVENIMKIMRETVDLLRDVEWFDTYEGRGMEKGEKSVAFHLTFSRPDRTLETAEVDEAMRRIQDVLKQKAGAAVRT